MILPNVLFLGITSKFYYKVKKNHLQVLQHSRAQTAKMLADNFGLTFFNFLYL